MGNFLGCCFSFPSDSSQLEAVFANLNLTEIFTTADVFIFSQMLKVSRLL